MNGGGSSELLLTLNSLFVLVLQHVIDDLRPSLAGIRSLKFVSDMGDNTESRLDELEHLQACLRANCSACHFPRCSGSRYPAAADAGKDQGVLPLAAPHLRNCS